MHKHTNARKADGHTVTSYILQQLGNSSNGDGAAIFHMQKYFFETREKKAFRIQITKMNFKYYLPGR